MANEEHLKILKQGVEQWNKWREENESIKPDLQVADLSGADLSDAKLSGSDLIGAKLIGASLGELSGAKLSGADLSDAILMFAELSGANLSGSKLSGAKLIGADLSDAILMFAGLSGADLSGANLSGADLSGASLAGADLGSANLTSADLTDADLSGAGLVKTDFTNVMECEAAEHRDPRDWEVIAWRVAPSVSAYMTALNNAGWSSPEAQADGLRSFRMAIAQLDSGEIDESKFVSQLALLMIRTVLPWGLEAAADLQPGDDPKESNRYRLNAAADGCRPVPDLAAAAIAAESAMAAAVADRSSYPAANAAWLAAVTAAWLATAKPASALSAAEPAAATLAQSGTESAAQRAWLHAAIAGFDGDSGATSETSDNVLSKAVEAGVRALIEAKKDKRRNGADKRSPKSDE
jgi:hypothetical protein